MKNCVIIPEEGQGLASACTMSPSPRAQDGVGGGQTPGLSQGSSLPEWVQGLVSCLHVVPIDN